jgi:hypothetical protein
MVVMYERRLGCIFRGALVAAAGAAAVQVACTSHDAAPDAGAPDATAGDDPVDVQEAGDEGGPSLGFDADIPDRLVWCEAGAPPLVARDGCEDYLWSVCGLPARVTPYDDAGNLNLVQCTLLCARKERGPVPYSCRIYPGPTDGGPPSDGGTDALVQPTFDLDGAPPGTLVFECEWCNNGGRRPPGYRAPPQPASRGVVGRSLAQMAELEAASIYAFRQLRRELRAHGAEPELVGEAARAAEDERRHARTVGRLARSWGAKPRRARFQSVPTRALEEIALENAVEGCVRETFGALVASWQGAHAGDARIRRAMRAIAIDETRHAALSWAVAAWAEARLEPSSRARVREARRLDAARLEREVRAPLPAPLVHEAGLPDAARARALPRSGRAVGVSGRILVALPAIVLACSNSATPAADAGDAAESCLLCADAGADPPWVDPRLGLPARMKVMLHDCTGTEPCHGLGSGGLTIAPGAEFTQLVNVRSTERPELFRVQPGDPAQSYLFLKLAGDGGIQGTRMPSGGSFDPRRPALAWEWIEAGAPP